MKAVDIAAHGRQVHLKDSGFIQVFRLFRCFGSSPKTETRSIGRALLPTDVPLVGRAGTTATGTVLFASREVAGPHGLSGSWVADHAIHAVKGEALSGSFTLRAVHALAR